MHSLTKQYSGSLQTDEDDPDFSDFPMEPRRENPFTITDDRGANWLLNKLAQLDEKRDRYTAQFNAITAEIEQDRARLMCRFGPELEALAQTRLAEDKGKSKTVKFLAGNVSFRSVPGGVRIVDTGAALEEAMAHFAGFVEMVPKLNTAAYRENAIKVLETSGELLPGCDNVPGRESMTIKFPNSWQFTQRKEGTPA